LYHFRATASYLSKVANFAYPSTFGAAPPSIGISSRSFDIRKLVSRPSCGVVCVVICLAILIKLTTCHGRTHSRTDRQTQGYSIYGASIQSRDNHNSSKVRVSQSKYRPIARRAFSVAGPSVWIPLPEYMRDPAFGRDSFRKQLKTFLFATY